MALRAEAQGDGAKCARDGAVHRPCCRQCVSPCDASRACSGHVCDVVCRIVGASDSTLASRVASMASENEDLKKQVIISQHQAAASLSASPAACVIHPVFRGACHVVSC